jgi:hypothetical protein
MEITAFVMPSQWIVHRATIRTFGFKGAAFDFAFFSFVSNPQ